MAQGKINVSVENIFPLIKKFLYSDHEIFLRELISNGTDATLKLKHLTTIGESKAEYGNPIIEVKIDKEGKKLHIIDQGLGMTAEEVEKYGRNRLAEGKLPLCAEMCSTKALIAGDGDIVADLFRSRVVRRGGRPDNWGWATAYKD